MEIKIELDLQSVIAGALSTERVKPIFEKAITDALKCAVETSTGYSSEFRKRLTAQLSEALPHGLDVNETAKFQFMLNQAVAECVGGVNARTIQLAMNEAVKHVVPDVPERIKLSELVQQARDGFHKEAHESFYAHFERTEYGYGHLALDSDASCRGAHLAKNRLSFDNTGRVYVLRLAGMEISPKCIPHAISRIESLLLALYVGRSSVEVDIDALDVESAAQGQED